MERSNISYKCEFIPACRQAGRACRGITSKMYKHLKSACLKLYQKFVLMNDSPQRIAVGFGVGVFLGILPFTGILAAIALAWFFRLNKTAAILGSVLTNTWLGFLVLGAAVQVGCSFLGLNSHDIELKFQHLVKDFHWKDLWDVSMLKIIAAVAGGYLIVSAALGLISYGICLGAIHWHRRFR